MLVLVTGIPSSCTRLVQRVVDASPDLTGKHDGSHGAVLLDADVVLDCQRDPYCVMRSIVARRDGYFGSHCQTPSAAWRWMATRAFDIATYYPDRRRVDIDSLLLPGGVDAFIATLAKELQIDPWTFGPEKVRNTNRRWLDDRERFIEIYERYMEETNG